MTWLKLLFLLGGALLLLPIALARWFVGASWLQIGIAYVVLIAGIAMLAAGANSGERAGWAFLLSVILLTPGVPLFCLALRLFRVTG